MLVRLAARVRFLVLALLLARVLAGVAHAQFTRFQNYTDEQGLGDLTVTALAQDRDGYLLLGTQGGLFRYDGSGMAAYDTQVGLPPSPWVGQLILDEAGRVWVVTTDGLFVRWRDGFSRVNTGSNVFDPAFAHLVAAGGNDVYVIIDNSVRHAVVAGRTVGRFAPAFDAATLARVPGLRDARFLAGGAHELLIGCGAALCRLAGGKLSVLGTADGLPAEAWGVALRGPDGTLWVRNLRHLAWRRPGQASFQVTDVPGRHSSFFAGHPGELDLIAAGSDSVLTQGDQGLLGWDGRSWRAFSHHDGGLSASVVESMLLDREGSLWVGSSGYGVFRSLGMGDWEHWTTQDGLPDNNVWAIKRWQDGQLWVSTEDGTAPLGRPGAAIPGMNYVLAVSRRGRLWVAPLGQPLARLEQPGGTEERFASVGNVLTAAIDGHDRLWLCTRNALYLVEDADAPASSIKPRLVLSHTRMNVTLDGSGTVWALSRDGVVREDEAGGLHTVVPASALQGQPIDAAFAPGGELWVATEQDGVLRFRVHDDRLASLPPLQAPTISSDAILSLHRDRRGAMWVGTDHGLDVFDGRGWRRYDSSEGTITNDLDEWSIFEDTDGSMWFGTSHGLSHLIDPRRPPPAGRLHPAITEVMLGNQTLPAQGTTRVGWTSSPLVVRFADLDFARGQVRFRYRLRGLGEGWTETAQHEVRYAQLPAGTLSFELVAVATGDRAVSGTVGFTIQIKPPWWRRWWFYVSCTAALLLVLLAIWKARVRLLLQQQNRLEALVAARTAEIEQARRELQEKSRQEKERLAGEQRRLEEMVRIRTTEIEQARQELERLALSDLLTGLANRRAIMDLLEKAVSAAIGAGTPLAVLLIDLDGFKSINDRFGHLAGDSVLACFGERLTAAIRPGELAGRYGGEEFLVILPGAPDAVRRRIAALRATVTGTPFHFAGADRIVTVSGGLAFLRPGDSAVTLIGRADAALYDAKGSGRDRVEEEPAAEALVE